MLLAERLPNQVRFFRISEVYEDSRSLVLAIILGHQIGEGVASQWPQTSIKA